ncbi:hypothetical protein, conserved [Eimeria brunetti]|uniref:Uncharacterized protein n=1 Tax=Eimeria brunetti TaxID=51314 RepID=U6LKZ8_9EIME|nr:hypothetical protein, conserved [Eimeria brunetti]
MKAASGWVAAAACLLCLAGVKADTRGLIQSFYKYDICRKDYLNIAATGDTKSPACWTFSRTQDPAERYKSFAAEISNRQFSFYGPRDRILSRLVAYAPGSIDLKEYKGPLLQQGLEAAAVPPDFKEKFLDFIAFLCCLSRQATDIKWSEEQIQRWEALGLDVKAELAKKVFEPPVAPKPEQEEPKPPAPPPPPPGPSEVYFGLKEAALTLPSGARASLHFDPSKGPIEIALGRPIEESSIEEIQEKLLREREKIQEKLLQAAHGSELPEARAVPTQAACKSALLYPKMVFKNRIIE